MQPPLIKKDSFYWRNRARLLENKKNYRRTEKGKEATRLYNKKYSELHKDEIRLYNKKYHFANKERNNYVSRVNSKKYRALYPERVAASARASVKKNALKVKSYKNKWYLGNKTRLAITFKVNYGLNKVNILRRMKEDNLRVKIKVFNHYSNNKNVCNCCGENRFHLLELDHLIPRRQKGATGMVLYWKLFRNIFPVGYQVLCRSCNGMKETLPQCPCLWSIENRLKYGIPFAKSPEEVSVELNV